MPTLEHTDEMALLLICVTSLIISFKADLTLSVVPTTCRLSCDLQSFLSAFASVSNESTAQRWRWQSDFMCLPKRAATFVLVMFRFRRATQCSDESESAVGSTAGGASFRNEENFTNLRNLALLWSKQYEISGVFFCCFLENDKLPPPISTVYSYSHFFPFCKPKVFSA